MFVPKGVPDRRKHLPERRARSTLCWPGTASPRTSTSDLPSFDESLSLNLGTTTTAPAPLSSFRYCTRYLCSPTTHKECRSTSSLAGKATTSDERPIRVAPLTTTKRYQSARVAPGRWTRSTWTRSWCHRPRHEHPGHQHRSCRQKHPCSWRSFSAGVRPCDSRQPFVVYRQGYSRDLGERTSILSPSAVCPECMNIYLAMLLHNSQGFDIMFPEHCGHLFRQVHRPWLSHRLTGRHSSHTMCPHAHIATGGVHNAPQTTQVRRLNRVALNLGHVFPPSGKPSGKARGTDACNRDDGNFDLYNQNRSRRY